MTILISILFIILCIIIYCHEKETSIALINAVMWTSLSLLVLLFQLPASGSAFAFVFICTVMFTASYILIRGKRINRVFMTEEECEEQIQYNKKKYRIIILIIAVLNLISFIFIADSLGFKLSTFTDIGRLMSRMNAVSSSRYSGDGENLPFVSRIINSIVYASMGFSGYYYVKDKSILHIINLIIILAETVILNTKATLVFALAFWIGGLFTGMKRMHKKLKPRLVVILFLVTVGILLITAGINYLRHTGVRTYFKELQSILYSYFLGPYSAFSLWFPTYDGSMELGVNTFSCIFKWLGFRAHEHGQRLSVISSFDTNVYTVFKHLLNDYSYVGTVLFTTILGVISGISMRNINSSKESAVCVSIVINATILICFFSSMFRYTTNLLACVLILAVPVIKKFTYSGRRLL